MNVSNKNLIIVVGLSGSGKTSVMEEVSKTKHILKIPTCTSRSPRCGEVDGFDYFFKNTSFFENNPNIIAKNLYGGNYYGIDTRILHEKLEQDDCYIVVDQTGFYELKKVFPQAFSILINTNLEDLEKRILLRDGDPLVAKKRMAINKQEHFVFNDYSLVVNNNDGEFASCIKEIINHL